MRAVAPAVWIVAVAALACAGGCRRAPPPDVQVDVQGFRGLEPVGEGQWMPVFAAGEPLVVIVTPRDSAELRIGAWIVAASLEDTGEQRKPYLVRYPVCPVRECRASADPVDGKLRAVVPTDALETTGDQPFGVAVAVWTEGAEGVEAWLAGHARGATFPAGRDARRDVALTEVQVIVDTRDRRTRDASEAVGKCREAYKGRAEDTEQVCRTALDGAAPRDRMLALERLGFLCRRGGRLEEAGQHFEQAAAAALEANLPAEQTTYLRLLAHARGERGDYVGARDAALRALAIDEQHGHLAWVARDRSNLGYFASRLGQSPWAIEELRGARQTSKLLGRRGDEANALMALAAAYQAVGRYERALAAMEAAQPWLEHGPEAPRYAQEAWATFQTNLGWIQLNARRRGLVDVDFEAIASSFDEALAIHTAEGLKTWQANDQMNLAQLELQQGHLAEARERMTVATELLADAATFEHAGYLLSLRGEVALAEGRFGEALGLYEELGRAEGEWAARWWADYGMARAHAGLARPDEAVHAFERSLDSLEGAAALLDPLIDRSYFLGDREEVFDRYIEFLLDTDRSAAAFEVSERSRERAARTAGGIRATGLDTAELDAAMATVSAARLELEAHEAEEAFLYGGRAAWEERRREMIERVVLAQAALATLLRDDETPRPVTAEELAAALPEGAVALYYHVTPDEVVVFAPRQGEAPKVFRQPLGRPGLTRYVRQFHDAIERGEDVRPSPELVRTLFPEELVLSRDSVLVVVTHGPLHGLPFHVVRLGRGFLVEQHPIAMAPSAGAFVQARAARSASGAATVAGDPGGDLRQALMEARAVAAFYPGATLLTGRKVNGEAIQLALNESEVVHFAGHAVVDAELPQYSHLRLAQGERLTWMDIQSMAVRSRLVVLSGCETGGGLSPSAGDDWGLSTALLDAGASTVIGSGWRVDDKVTRLFMERFHFHGLSASPAEALRRTQVEMILGHEGLQAVQPRSWGAFALFGNPGS